MKDFRNDREAGLWFELNYPDLLPKGKRLEPHRPKGRGVVVNIGIIIAAGLLLAWVVAEYL